MRHHLYNPNSKFVIEPENFDKYTEREILRYCLGAAICMPETKGSTSRIISGPIPGLTATVPCFEDACPVDRVEAAEANVYRFLDTIADTVGAGALSPGKIPLISVRTRNFTQFKRFGDTSTKRQVRFLCDINPPKFDARDGYEYCTYLEDPNKWFGEILYDMPIIEDSEMAYKESHTQELAGAKKILGEYHNLVLRVHVGGADFSSIFDVRRGVDYFIYDIMTVRGCLADIVNVCGCENGCVISGPIWEYFRAPRATVSEELPCHGLEDYLMKQLPTINGEIDSLLREVVPDRANSFVDHTVIHPTHVRFVNTLMTATKEEYDDACMILKHTQGGVVKRPGTNGMNRVRPYTNWAKKVCNRARAFGMIKNEGAYIKLFVINESQQEPDVYHYRGDVWQ